MPALVTLGLSASSLLTMYLGVEAAQPTLARLDRRQDNHFICSVTLLLFLCGGILLKDPTPDHRLDVANSRVDPLVFA